MGSQESIKRERIMLPVDESGNPDYAFMEQYIKEREQQIIQNYIEYIGKNIQTGGGYFRHWMKRNGKNFTCVIFSLFAPESG